MTSQDSFKFFFRIKSSDPAKLCSAIEEFVENLNTLVEEGIMPDDIYEEVFCKTPIQVASYKDGCLVIVDMVSSEPSQALEDILIKMYESVGKINPYIVAEVSLGAGLSDLTENVVF